MSEATNTAGDTAGAAAPVEKTGLVAHIEKLFAETGDAALHGLRHLAGEIEKIAHGGVEPAALETAIEAKLKSVVGPFFTQLQAAFENRLKDLEAELAQLTSQVQGQPASPPPPAPAPVPEKAPGA